MVGMNAHFFSFFFSSSFVGSGKIRCLSHTREDNFPSVAAVSLLSPVVSCGSFHNQRDILLLSVRDQAFPIEVSPVSSPPGKASYLISPNRCVLLLQQARLPLHHEPTSSSPYQEDSFSADWYLSRHSHQVGPHSFSRQVIPLLSHTR